MINHRAPYHITEYGNDILQLTCVSYHNSHVYVMIIPHNGDYTYNITHYLLHVSCGLFNLDYDPGIAEKLNMRDEGETAGSLVTTNRRLTLLAHVG